MRLPPPWAIGLAVGAFVLALARRLGSGASSFTAMPTPGRPLEPWMAGPEPPTSFDPVAKPGVLLFRKWALSKWGERPGSPQNIIRTAAADKPSDHHEGRAWDLMTNSLAHGQSVADAITANQGELARRAGISYIIWNHQMWRAYPYAGAPPGSWSPYSGASPHTDHVHISFSWAGARGETSLYDELRREFPAS